jgi:hypothetical protein
MNANARTSTWIGPVCLLLVIEAGAAFISGCVDPNDNPIIGVAATCQADSQDQRFFGSAFTYENETGRALLARTFKALAENSEPSLACGAEPDEGYRLTIVGQWPNVPLIIRTQKVAEVAMLRATFPRHDSTTGTLVLDRLERPLSSAEWSSLSAHARSINLVRMRAILASEDERDYTRRRLIEFRRDGNYGLVQRPSVRSADVLDSFTVRLIELAGIDYPWF